MAEAVELDVVQATSLPQPSSWTIACPVCGSLLEYEPEEDDAGAFTPVQDWPLCEACDVVVQPATVQIREVEEPYWQDSF